MGWKKYFKPVNSVLPAQDRNAIHATSMVSKFSTWLPEIYQGPPNRLQRYVQYEQMDLDHEVNAALDTLAEFSTQNDEKTNMPFEFRFHEDPSSTELKVLERSLKQWCKLNDFSKRMFRIFRSTLMYGDQFLIRDPETFKLYWIDPATVEKVIVNESKGKDIEAYYVRDLDLNLQEFSATNTSKKGSNGYNSIGGVFPNAPLSGQQVNYTSASAPSTGTMSGNGDLHPVMAEHVVHISLTEGMNNAWPFGLSVLEPIFKVYKQKELLEDSILIYRIHRAPERRVFFIDVGTMPPNKAQQYLERIRYEVQQKRIPSRTGGGQNVTDSSYNPMSQLEDYFFAQTSDGRGSKVETLPGGENLGEIDDLRYFNNKMLRALGVPSSYLPSGPEDGSSSYNDGRVGTAFIQEFRFAKTCKRFQAQIVEQFDTEFKLFLKHRGITIDNSVFEIMLTEPQNFSAYRQMELDSAQASVYNSLVDVKELSKRFKFKRYLGLTEDEIIENEELWKEENNVDLSDPTKEKTEPDLRQVGANVSGGEFADFDDVDLDDESTTDETDGNEDSTISGNEGDIV